MLAFLLLTVACGLKEGVEVSFQQGGAGGAEDFGGGFAADPGATDDFTGTDGDAPVSDGTTSDGADPGTTGAGTTGGTTGGSGTTGTTGGGGGGAGGSGAAGGAAG
ncbi:MAG TPA: hypothetical protein VNU01_08395, partial [Egibacteraceae bacterium]|nr:hypothetical protein [Egibacteraceae bacterium]